MFKSRRILTVAAVLAALIGFGQAPAHASEAESHTGTVVTVYPRHGEGIISITARTCASTVNWRAVASAAGVTGPAFWVYYGRGYRINCAATVTRTTTTASRSSTRATTYVRPVSGSGTSSCYGWRAWSNSFHQGIDLPRPGGTPIRSVAAGTVVSAGWNGGYGREVVVYHGGGVWSQYAHASSIVVRNGQRVAAGQIISRVGTSGQSTGNHLHFEIRIGTVKHRINPAPWLRSHRIGMGC